MIILQLEAEEARVLARTLQDYLSDLRMEIADTDSYTMREGLKQEEVTIRRVIDRLEELNTEAA